MSENNEPVPDGAMVLWYQHNAKSPSIQVTTPPDLSLDDALDVMTGFLLAVGYRFDGHLDIIVDPSATLN